MDEKPASAGSNCSSKNRYVNRRQVLSAFGSAGLLAVAGCMGGTQGANEIQEIQQLADLDPKEWRETVSEKAADELENDDLQYYSVDKSEAMLDLVNNHDYSGVYEPLRDSINIVQQDGDTLPQRYIQAQEADDQSIDVTDMSSMDALIKDGYEFTDISHVPAYQSLPDSRKVHPQIGIRFSNAYGISYNTELVEEPPTSLEDLLEPRFADGRILMDWNPKEALTGALLQDPGEEWLEKLAHQNPTTITSLYSVPKDVAKGRASVAFMANFKHIWQFQEQGLPTKPVKNPSTIKQTAGMWGVAKSPKHPWASLLLTDKILSWKEYQTNQLGAISADMSESNPAELAELMGGKPTHVMTDFDRSTQEIIDTYANIFHE